MSAVRQVDDLLEELLVELLEEDKADSEWLVAHPEVRDELEPLERAARELRSALRTPAPADVRARIEHQVMTSRAAERLMDARRNRAHRSYHRWWNLRFAAVSAVMLVVLFGSLAGTSVHALPGSPVYGFKRATETVWLWLTPANSRGAVHLRLAERRLEEFEALLDLGRFDQATLDELGREVETALALAGEMPAELAGPLLRDVMDAGVRHEQKLASLLDITPTSSRTQVEAAMRASLARTAVATARFEIISPGVLPTRTQPPATPTRTPTATRTPTSTTTRTATPTYTSTATRTATPSPTVTVTLLPVAPTDTVTVEATDPPAEAEPTETAEVKPTKKPLPTPRPTNTHRPTAKPTSTPKPTKPPKVK